MNTIGAFDSGVGGLSVLRALLLEMPEAHFVYVADSAHAPYGERSAQPVIERALRIGAELRRRHAIDALVVACNTATALAIDALRATHPDLPIIGVEPALKPAAASSRSGHIGVLATRSTIESERFARLRARLQAQADAPLHFSCQPCPGLAEAIERDDRAATQALCERYVLALQAGADRLPALDTLVLGCTHYPFAAEPLRRLCGPGVALVDTGAAVARRTREVLDRLPHAPRTPAQTLPAPALTLLATGEQTSLTQAAQRWLGVRASASRLHA